MFKFLILFLCIGVAYADYPILDLGGITTNAAGIAGNATDIQSNQTEIQANDVELADHEARLVVEESISVDLNTRGTLIASDGANNVQFDPCADGEIIVWNNDALVGFECQVPSGGGGGGGSNFNNAFILNQVNNNAEQGLLGWVDNGGILSLETTDPLEGQNSFTWIPSAVGDFIDSPEMNFNRNVLLGNACQIQLTYIGADENIEIQIVDGNDVVVASEQLDNLPLTSFRDFFFLCPRGSTLDGSATPAEILMDTRLRNLRVRLINSGPALAQPITFDKVYAGTNFLLTKAVLPDTLSATVASDGTIVSGNLFSGSCNFALGYDCPLAGTFDNPLACTAIATNSSFLTASQTNTNTSVNIRFISRTDSSTTNGQSSFSVICHKQGSDAQQEVQIFANHPTIAGNSNTVSGRFDAAGNLLSSNLEGIITGSNVGSARYEVDISALNLQNLMSCSTAASSAVGDQVVHYDFTNSTNALLVFRGTFADANNVLAQNFSFTCDRQGIDIIRPSVQPIIVGQVRTNSKMNIVHKFCSIRDNGTGGTFTLGDSCDDWVQSMTLGNSNRRFDLTIIDGVFPNDDISCNFTRNIESMNNTGSGIGSEMLLFVSRSLIQFSFFNTANSNFVPFVDGADLTCSGRL